MNVHCTSCGTVYRVDPAKVSEAGVRARCTVCSNVIAITATGDRQPEVAPVLAAAPRRSQEQMAAQGLGDAFIPVPDDAQLSPPPPPRPPRLRRPMSLRLSLRRQHHQRRWLLSPRPLWWPCPSPLRPLPGRVSLRPRRSRLR
ncbi:MAG: zinc-ribbon domain-containing protein [Gemmatimonadetes bacterium]|nr:zinc-ribbon domain-containing protein [Gemmatimonadota bacterium]